MSRTSKTNAQVDVSRTGRNRAFALSKRGRAIEANGHARGSDDAFDPQSLLDALQSVRVGDFSVRLPRDQGGLAGKMADAFNEIVAANERMAQQLEQVGEVEQWRTWEDQLSFQETASRPVPCMTLASPRQEEVQQH